MEGIPAQYRAMRAAKPGSEEDEPEQDQELNWKEQLLEVLSTMDPEGFERLARRLLREAGFENVRVTRRGADGGIDGSGMYRISLVSFPVLAIASGPGGG